MIPRSPNAYHRPKLFSNFLRITKNSYEKMLLRYVLPPKYTIDFSRKKYILHDKIIKFVFNISVRIFYERLYPVKIDHKTDHHQTDNVGGTVCGEILTRKIMVPFGHTRF